MAFKPNYRQQRGERDRAKEQKKRERLRRREEDAEKRKAERDGLLSPNPDPAAAPSRPAVLEQVAALPGAERHRPRLHRNGELGLRKRRADMGGHVVRALGLVDVA